MKTLLMLTVVGTIMIATGLTGLYVQLTRRIAKIERDIKDYRMDIRKNRHDIAILKERDAQASDHIIITHEYADKDAPNYGGF